MSEILANRHDFMFFVEAKGCNPNGDPDMGNLPRQDEDTELGYITDVALKRRIRNYIQDAYGDAPNMQILMQKKACINEKIAESVLAVNNIDKFPDDETENKKKKPYKNKKTDETEKYMSDKYWDVRTFGGVLSTGRNAGQVRGAVQLTGANFSLDPIQPKSITITRMCYTDGGDYSTLEEYRKADQELVEDDKKCTMGTKTYIPYGLYLVRGSVSACLAKKNGFTEDDLNKFYEAIIQMYNHDISSSKEGMSVVGPLIIFKHVGTQAPENEEQNKNEARLGCAPAYKLFELLDIKKKENVIIPRKYDDYDITLNVTGIPRGVCVGFKSYPFEAVKWYDGGTPDQYRDLDITLK